ncbi:MAG: fused response regulator/thioredoxin-disulfide reductase [Acidobacteria bacterium]|nr:fused response regulator/thioredoxin-disulfide reductase [Acidobacteriota bacterium]
MFLVLAGYLVLRVERDGDVVRAMEWRAGDVAGLLPHSRLGAPPGDSSAEEVTEIVVIKRHLLPDLIAACPVLTAALVQVMVDRARQFAARAGGESTPPAAATARLIGRQWSAESHTLKDFLAAHGIAYTWMEAESDPSAAGVMAATGVSADDLPALLLPDGSVLRRPAPAEIAQRLGLQLDARHDFYDLIIAGAGPAGLAAAVYGASEGLRTLLLDRHAPGGQAGTSSRIENYLGFPEGLSGAELARRAALQAGRLGAEMLSPVAVTSIAFDQGYKRVALSSGRRLVAPALIIATGMTYREHRARGIAELNGAGVYYGSAAMEAHACRGANVIVVGGGNSAGQCALNLARYAATVQIVVRREGLGETMSHYLAGRIAETPNIQVRGQTTIEAVEGQGRLERVHLTVDGAPRMEEASALFILIGTQPHSGWLPPEVLRDARGFVLTGRDVAGHPEFSAVWREPRGPMPFETSVPGVFAAGDVRAGAMNRVASAVGEGAMAMRLADDYLKG